MYESMLCIYTYAEVGEGTQFTCFTGTKVVTGTKVCSAGAAATYSMQACMDLRGSLENLRHSVYLLYWYKSSYWYESM